MIVSVIAAVAENGVIGHGGELPWRLPADLRRFRQLTTGHHIVMGRKTFDSIGKPLPDRTTIVITRNRQFGHAGVSAVGSITEAMELARRAGETELFVIGGAEIYREALSIADRLFLTQVHAQIAGDTFFPAVDLSDWIMTEHSDHAADERHMYAYSFLCYDRRKDRGLRQEANH